MIKYKRKGTKNRHRATFTFENGFVKCFVCNTKKERRRVKRFESKYVNSTTWFDENIDELKIA